MADLTTTYLGLALSNPLVASASPLSKNWTVYADWKTPELALW